VRCSVEFESSDFLFRPTGDCFVVDSAVSKRLGGKNWEFGTKSQKSMARLESSRGRSRSASQVVD
jgi:hypothetical protein